MCDASNVGFAQSVTDYQIVKITNVDLASDSDTARLTGTVVRGVGSGKFSMGVPAAVDGTLASTAQDRRATGTYINSAAPSYSAGSFSQT